MKKTLFFAAVLLVPSLAHSANPSADLSVQVVPPSSNGIACDVGPNYTGTIPDGAAKAGYTHCLMNLDFTNAQFTNVNTWINCFGASSPIMWLGKGSIPCDSSHFAMVTDGGVQVLRIQFSQSDINAGLGESSLVSSNYQSNRIFRGVTVPLGNYVEFVSRVNALHTASIGSLMWAPYFYNPESNDYDTFLEEDWGELGDSPTQTNPASLNTAGGWWNCGGVGGTCFGVGPISPPIYENPLVYNTNGMLITGDGSSATSFCGYHRQGTVAGLQHGDFVSCLQGNWQNPAGSYNGQANALVRNHMILTVGYEHGTAPTLSQTQIAYTQRVTVWVCPGGGVPSGGNLVGNQCNVSPVLTSSPPL
jgi:hypothetical protein